jgi:hypothetical protein
MEEKQQQVVEIKSGFYRHFKGGIYYVIGISYDSETVMPYVVYMHFGMDSLGRNNAIWHRPYEMFVGTKEVEGKIVKRYEFIGEQLPTI